MGAAEFVAIIIAIFSGLGFMAYNHHDWFMPFSGVVLHALLASWGFMAGFSIALTVVLKKVPDASAEIINEINEIEEIINGIPMTLWLSLLGLFVLRQVSDYIYTQNKHEKNI